MLKNNLFIFITVILSLIVCIRLTEGSPSYTIEKGFGVVTSIQERSLYDEDNESIVEVKTEVVTVPNVKITNK